jgi:hypothetical protein
VLNAQQLLQNKDTTHAQMLKTVLPVSGFPSFFKFATQVLKPGKMIKLQLGPWPS